MFRLLPLFLSLLTAQLFGCTWVALDEPAHTVLVLPPERLAPECRSIGKVKVSVLDSVGVLERHADEVEEDLHVLARNQAAKQHGDTVVARGPIVEGVREYEMYRCLDATTQGDKPAESTPDTESNVEVLPYDGGN